MISVCIATYNGGKYIRQQIESILPQIGLEDEIVISDDGSTDNTHAVIESFQCSQIRLLKHSERLGYIGNFERCLNHSKGDIIFLCDQDDIWLPNKVSLCLQALNHSDLVVTNARILKEDGRISEDTYFDMRKSYKSFWGNILKFGYLGCCMCFKKSILLQALPFPPNRQLCTHDNWLYIVGAAFYDVSRIDTPCIYYRRHSSNASGGGFAKPTNFIFKLSYRLYLMYHILLRKLRCN